MRLLRQYTPLRKQMAREAEVMTLGATLMQILWMQLRAEMAAAAAMTLPGCLEACGNISIPYPFGVGLGCYREGFNLTCDQTSQPPKLYLGDGSIEVFELSFLEGTVSIYSKVLTLNLTTFFTDHSELKWTGLTEDGPYTLSATRNKFTAIGCDILAFAWDPIKDEYISLCAPMCTGVKTPASCSGIKCCQTSVPVPLTGFNITIKHWNENIGLRNRSHAKAKAFMVADTISPAHLQDVGDYSPVVLDWMITDGRESCEDANNMTDFACRSENSVCYNLTSPLGYRCNCSYGYQGNPYIDHGCRDINECENLKLYPCFGTCINMPGSYNCSCPEGTHGNPIKATCVSNKNNSSAHSGVIIGLGIGIGLSLLLISIILLSRALKKRNAKKLKEKFFKQNHGLLLQQLIFSNKDIADTMKIFIVEELQKATDNFDKSRIVGQGGHGIVYKGILLDQRVVAIKKSKIIIQREINQFINEVVVLSQISHRNVVKLFGCCLETEVPLLVYEFISNGTLSKHLHTRELSNSLSWKDRLRIAVEAARALAYLHSAASIAIFHRDIKSCNILLDDNFTVKVSDFGASRTIPLDQSRIMTAIQGTFGYLDPEYFHTSQFTDKSDVYSFGVILVELLTRERPIFYTRLQEEKNLGTHFLWLLRENRVFEILDPQVVEESERRELEVVVALAEKCLRLKGEDRPTMKEVEITLEALRGSKKQLRDTRITKKPKGSEILLKHLQVGVSSSTTSRQYSLEKELILSSNFPR